MIQRVVANDERTAKLVSEAPVLAAARGAARAFGDAAIDEATRDMPEPQPVEKVLGPRRRLAKAKIGRNDPCHCGSGMKYKKCHGR